MNKDDLQRLLNGETIQVGTYNNRIALVDGVFCLEKFECKDYHDEDMFSFYDSYENIEDAIKYANIVNPRRPDYIEIK
jgi:hypothetical protein